MEAIIIFKDGTRVRAEKNGDCLILDTKVRFPNDLKSLVIESAEGTKEFEYAQLLECASADGRYWFTFVEIPEDERIKKQMQANIEYIAMMSDIDLEEV